jgi:pimeloyl-ACP methyl ester carboxylesterase
MRTHDLRIDVERSTGLAGAEIACSLHLPDDPPMDAPGELLVCLHGGGYTRAYWHPNFPNFPGYSFAEHICARGRAVLAIDLLGMGESVKPEPETLLSRAIVAAANHQVTAEISAGFRNGRWGRMRRLATTGIGHSIGGMMVITQQAAHQSFDRLAVLGWANQPLVLAGLDPAVLAASIAPGYLASPREKMRPLFYAPDVPEALIETDEAAGSTTPACLGRDALRPGIVHEESAAITVPVFVMHGSTDTSPNPHGEAAFFRASNDITLMRLPETAHCHNFATLRHRLWDRLDSWIVAFPASATKDFQ